MKTFTQFLFAALVAFGIQACGGSNSTNNNEGDSSKTTTDTSTKTNTPTDKKAEETSTKPEDESKTAERRNKDMEQRLLGIWGDKDNMSQFTFSADNKFHQITPVPEIKGTYKVVGDILTLDGIKTMDGEKDEKVNDKYKIAQITDKKILKLKTMPGGELVRILRYGEKLD